MVARFRDLFILITYSLSVWKSSKLKNKIWHSDHNRHIALLKRTQKRVKIGYSVYIYKTTRLHSETILAVSPKN